MAMTATEKKLYEKLLPFYQEKFSKLPTLELAIEFSKELQTLLETIADQMPADPEWERKEVQTHVEIFKSFSCVENFDTLQGILLENLTRAGRSALGMHITRLSGINVVQRAAKLLSIEGKDVEANWFASGRAAVYQITTELIQKKGYQSWESFSCAARQNLQDVANAGSEDFPDRLDI